MKMMQTYENYHNEKFHVADISRRTRIFALLLITLSMIAISANFYQADAVLLQASILPFYILFFVLMYVVCIVVEYVSLWCERGNSFHCARIAVHALALMLVTYETGAFYSSGHDTHSQFPSWSVTKALSHVITPPSAIDNARI